MKSTPSPNCCYCEKPHGKSSPLTFQSCDACQAAWDKQAVDASNSLISVSCPRCNLLFSASIEDEISQLLSYREREVLKSADDLFKKYGLNQHAVVVRELLARLGGEK